MGEKETMTAVDEAARSGTLNVSASPGGSAGILSAGGSEERKGPNAVNVKLA